MYRAEEIFTDPLMSVVSDGVGKSTKHRRGCVG